MTTRKYDYDYNFDPVGTSIVQPDPYAENVDVLDVPTSFPLPPSPPSTTKGPGKAPMGGRFTAPQPPRDSSIEESSTERAMPLPPLEPHLQEPSEEYLAISAEPSSKLEDPKSERKLLVLDLNGTLVYRSPHQRRNVYQQPHAVPRPLRTVHPRPYLTSFRDYLFNPRTKEWLDTMVWSSAQPHSVSDMVEKAFGDTEGLTAVWARDTLGLTQDAYFKKTQTTKDLEKPWKALGHSAKSTFLLDDSPTKAHLQPWNHLCIREYVGEMRQTDVQVRDAEILREQRERAEIAPSTSTVPVAEDHGEGKVEGDAKMRRRKEKKEKKRTEKMAAITKQDLYPVDANGRPLTYDQTLLAVVGVLDAIKEESNVAGWTRSGGLLNSAQSGSGSPSGPATKKRRLSGESVASEPPASSSPPQSAVESITGEKVAPEVSQEVPLASNLWFEHEESFQHWACRGRRSLEELGIEIRPGIVGTNG